MLKDRAHTDKELTALIQERGLNVLEKFKRVIFPGVEHSKLLSSLEDVKSYWKDAYRPALTSFSCEAVGGKPEDAITVSIMITLAGAGIGIHDDLIDKSLTKHFRRTILKLHGFDHALLTGDLLIVKALTTVRDILKEVSPSKVSDVIETYEYFLFNICDGECMDISCRKNIDTDIEYYHRALWKLGADAEACTKLGAILGDGSKREVEALREYGRQIGYLFRLAGDVKDTLNLEGNLPVRLQNESIPLPILYASKVSKEKYFNVKSILKEESITPLDVKRLLDLCFETEAFIYVQNIAKKIVKEGIEKLNILKSSKARSALILMIDKAFPDITNIY